MAKMRMSIPSWWFGVLLIASGCASGADECHPGRVSNVLMAARCQMGGGFDAYLSNEREKVTIARQKQIVAVEELQSRRIDMRRLSAENDELQRRLHSEQGQLDRLSLRLAQVRTETNQEKARKIALQEQLAEAQSRHGTIVAATKKYNSQNNDQKNELQKQIDTQQMEIIKLEKFIEQHGVPKIE